MVCRFLTVGALSVALAGLVACSGDSKVAQCNSTSECPSGEVCQNKVCSKTCDSSTVCPGGYSCQNGLCVSGSTGVPEITSISGKSTETCDDGEACIGSGFIVAGKHLTNTTFTLSGPGSTTRSFEMTRSDNNSDTTAELTPVLPLRTTDLQEGKYQLVAVNQSGDTTAEVQLLRGEPGPDLTADQLIDRINTAADGKRIQAKFLDVTSGGGGSATGLLSSYTNDEPVSNSTLQLREMRVVVNGTDTGSQPHSVAVNNELFEALCGDANGCELTLGATRFRSPESTDYIIDAPMNGGGCRFYLNLATHSWTLSQDCVVTYQTLNRVNNAFVEGDNQGAYQNYEYSTAYGVDGSDPSSAYNCNTTAEQKDKMPLAVMTFKSACYFAEAPAEPAVQGKACLKPDSAAGFYVIASASGWDYSTYPSALWPTDDAARQCILTVKD